YTIDYQVKGSDRVDQFQDGSVMTIVMERSHIVPVQYAKYALTMSYGGVLDESPDEETILQEYRNYRKDHPVTDEMIGEAKAQITEELKKRIEKAVSEGTWGMEGYQKEDIPKLLEGIRIYPVQEENEEAAVLSTAQGYRMPFRQHKAVFAMDYEFLGTDPKTGETLSPFGRRTRVFFLGYGMPLEYADMMEE
ncbi:MAG: hypothetical protein IJU49_10215, partial [Lachnospiraceae bacterium]|nr:hypothetical protein [Lachnospiraceae bacterium]